MSTTSPQTPGSSYSTPWMHQMVLYPLASCLLALTQATGVAFVIRSFEPTLTLGWLLATGFVLSLEGIATTRWLDAGQRSVLHRLLYRFAELMLVICVIRAGVLMEAGGVRALGAMFDLGAGWNSQLAFSSMLVAILWLRATGLDTTLSRLSISEAEARLHVRHKSQQQRDQHLPRRAESRSSLARELTSSWIWGGVTLVICAVVSRFALEPSGGPERDISIASGGLPSLMTSALLVYFVLGLWLVSRARNAAMNEWWMVPDAVKDHRVEARWSRYALGLLLVAGLLVSMLPAGTSIPLLEWLTTLWRGLVWLVVTPLGWLMEWFSSLLSSSGPTNFSPELAADAVSSGLLPQSLPDRAAPSEPLQVSQLVPALLFVVVAAALLYMLHDRRLGLKHLLVTLGSKIWQWLKKLLRRDSQLHSEDEPSGSVHGKMSRLERLENLLRDRKRKADRSTRGQLLTTYVELVALSKEQGGHRQPGDTPNELQPMLSTLWPDNSDDVASLTTSFNRARYTNQDVTPDELTNAREGLERIKGST